MTNRRTFIKQASYAGMLASIPSILLPNRKPSERMIWAYLLQLSNNMWQDHISPEYKDENFICKTCDDAAAWTNGYRPYLTFDETTWDKLLKEMVTAGINMVVIDLGNGIQYESHSEISVKNAWSTTQLRTELSKIRKMGLEPIPKLNFSTTHDIWMGEYSRMVSTEKYYSVCRDLIEEVISHFDKPRFFHLGMDEESASNQARQDYICVRQNDLWWGDFYFYIGEVERNGVRPWIWSDYVWHHPDVFFKKMPKSVLQSNWYYDTKFGPDVDMVKYYNELEKYGYDQIPTGSNHSDPSNFGLTVDYCKNVIDPSRLLGFMSAPWRPTLAPCYERHKEAIDQVASAKEKFDS